MALFLRSIFHCYLLFKHCGCKMAFERSMMDGSFPHWMDGPRNMPLQQCSSSLTQCQQQYFFAWYSTRSPVTAVTTLSVVTVTFLWVVFVCLWKKVELWIFMNEQTNERTCGIVLDQSLFSFVQSFGQFHYTTQPVHRLRTHHIRAVWNDRIDDEANNLKAFHKLPFLCLKNISE